MNRWLARDTREKWPQKQTKQPESQENNNLKPWMPKKAEQQAILGDNSHIEDLYWNTLTSCELQGTFYKTL